jgi:hypothetical protein
MGDRGILSGMDTGSVTYDGIGVGCSREFASGTGISETCDRVAHWLRLLRTLLTVDILVERANGAIPYETGWVRIPAGETK